MSHFFLSENIHFNKLNDLIEVELLTKYLGSKSCFCEVLAILKLNICSIYNQCCSKIYKYRKILPKLK